MVKRRSRKKKTREIKEKKFDITSIIFAVCIVVIIGAVIYYAFIKMKSSPPGDTTENITQIDSTAIKEEEEIPAAREEETPVQTVLQIEILNGCGVSRLAARLADFMRQNGFDVVNTDNYTENGLRKTNVQNSFLIDRVGNEANAKRIADALGIDNTNIKTEISSELMLDATVVIGQDYRNLKYFSQQ